ncbi:MAG: hypothetical protein L6284_14205, partial [Brevundimonas sp.]|nr:hypothetical protein [Brevundimonas sp.]
MSGAHETEQVQRRTLLVVLFLNALLFVGLGVGGRAPPPPPRRAPPPRPRGGGGGWGGAGWGADLTTPRRPAAG